MMKFLSSSLFTGILILALAGYLLQGKLLGGSLNPKVMVVLASLLIVQSGWAIIMRALMLLGKVSGRCVPFKPKNKELFRGSLEEASESLKARGFQLTKFRNNQNESSVFFSRGLRRSRLLELMAYSGLVFALVSGLFNYGLGISGHVDLSPGNTLIQMDDIPLERGFLARQANIPLRLRASELTYATAEHPSSVLLEITDEDKGAISSHTLGTGKSIKVNRLKMRYLGDAYHAFISVMKKRHDYRPSPFILRFRSGPSGKTYTGAIDMREPGTNGEGEFNPVSRMFRIKVYRDSNVEFDKEFLYGKSAVQGDFIVRIPALMHSARVEISRYGFRNEVIGGMTVFVVFLLARMMFRPGEVYLWSEGESVFFYTMNSSIRRSFLKR